MSSNKSNIPASPNIFKKSYYSLIPFRYRYGKGFNAFFKFLLQSSEWSEDKLKQYQNEEFLKLVKHCYKNVPYYQEKFAEYGIRQNSIQSIDDITKLPILNKENIRKNINKLQATNMNNNVKKYPFSTSGSTGEKLQFFGTDEVFKKEAAFILRYYIQTGAEMYDKPSIWLRRYVPENRNSQLWYFDEELKRLYISAYHINQETIFDYFKIFNSIKASTLVTYPSSAYILAKLAKKNNLSFKYINQIRVASEKMQHSWAEEINNVFKIKPLAHYGQIEKVSFMHQTHESNDYKYIYEYGVTELHVDNNYQNKILGTGFLNYYMPFLRYDTGDYAESAHKENPKIVTDILGRTSDLLISENGTLLPGVNFFSWIDKNIENISLYQIIQNLDKTIEFHYVPDGIKIIDEKKIIHGLQQRLGNLPVKVIVEKEIKRNIKTGKLKLIKNEIQI